MADELSQLAPYQVFLLSMSVLQDGASVMAGRSLAGPVVALDALCKAGAARQLPQAGLLALVSLMADAADPHGRTSAAVALDNLVDDPALHEAVAQAALPTLVAVLKVCQLGGDAQRRGAWLLRIAQNSATKLQDSCASCHIPALHDKSCTWRLCSRDRVMHSGS